MHQLRNKPLIIYLIDSFQKLKYCKRSVFMNNEQRKTVEKIAETHKNLLLYKYNKDEDKIAYIIAILKVNLLIFKKTTEKLIFEIFYYIN